MWQVLDPITKPSYRTGLNPITKWCLITKYPNDKTKTANNKQTTEPILINLQKPKRQCTNSNNKRANAPASVGSTPPKSIRLYQQLWTELNLGLNWRSLFVYIHKKRTYIYIYVYYLSKKRCYNIRYSVLHEEKISNVIFQCWLLTKNIL